jgi:hypothetical protein
LAALCTSCGVKKAPYFVGQLRICGRIDVGALDLRRPVLVAGDDLPRVDAPAGRVLHAGSCLIASASSGRQRRRVALAHAHAALGEVAGVDHDHVGAGRLDALFDRRARAGAERHHRDDGADADDHPEHRQDGAHLVAVERLQRDPQGHQD